MKTLFEIFRERVPAPDCIVEQTLQKLAAETVTPLFIKKHFSKLVEELQIDAYKEYLKAQKKSGELTIKDYLLSKTDVSFSRDEVIRIVATCFEDFDRFCLSLTQSRRQRAGSAFEDIIKTLFKKLNYPFAEQQIINGKPDFLMPNRKHYNSNAMDCIIFTAKRTLRERWRQIVTEGTRGLGFYLATIDDGVSEIQIQEMKNNRIYLVLPLSLKRKIPHYSKAFNVISFEDFFTNHLDPAVKRWKKAKII